MCSFIQLASVLPKVINRKMTFSVKFTRVVPAAAIKLPSQIKLGKEADYRVSEDEMPRPSTDTLV